MREITDRLDNIGSDIIDIKADIKAHSAHIGLLEEMVKPAYKMAISLKTLTGTVAVISSIIGIYIALR